jgi:hypothetical protein
MTWMEGTQTNEETWMTEYPMQLLVSECSIASGLLFLKKPIVEIFSSNMEANT